ncbi:MAG: glycosyltransferase family 39 protein [Candidatus Jettenia sp.]|nr:MAG: glycosyltransferase family 39 protein [Candidatus Jettenia sp.]
MRGCLRFLFSSNRMKLKLGIVLSLAAIFYSVALFPDILGLYHDDAIYAVTAKALAEGKGYRIISLPESPVQISYPIFYPAVLSLVWHVFPRFPENIIVLKAPSIIFTLLFLFLVYFYLVRKNYASPSMALLIVIMTAFNPWMVWAATMVMSEALYCLVSLLSLWAIELFVSNTRGYKHLLYLTLAGVSIAISIMTRSIGISILGAAFLYLFFHRKRSIKEILLPALQLLLVVLLFLSPWIIWTVLQYVHHSHREVLPYSIAFRSYGSAVNSLSQEFGIIFFFKIFFINIYRCFLGAVPNLLLPGVDIGKIEHLNFLTDYIHLFCIVILCAALSLSFMIPLARDFILRKYSLVTMHILFLMMIILFWPFEPDRFLIPVLPFILLYFINGFSYLMEKFKYFYRDKVPLVISKLPWLIPLSFFTLNCGLALAQECTHIVRSGRSSEWVEKKKIFQWIKENTGSDDIVATSVSPALYLYTGRKSIPSIVGMDLNDLSKFSSDIVTKNFKNLLEYANNKNVYLVKIAYFSPAFEHMIDRLAIKYPDHVLLMYTGKSMKYAIYKIIK